MPPQRNLTTATSMVPAGINTRKRIPNGVRESNAKCGAVLFVFWKTETYVRDESGSTDDEFRLVVGRRMIARILVTRGESWGQVPR